MSKSLFHKYGGFATCRKIVSAFYDRVLDNPVLQKHFVGVDMPRLIDHQTNFVTFIMGGPANVSDERLARAHRGLNITMDEFAEMAHVMGGTLEDHEIEPEDVSYLMMEIRKRSHLIVF